MDGRITTKAAGKLLGLAPARIRQLIAAGALSAVREVTSRGDVLWLDPAEVASYTPQPAGWRKGRARKTNADTTTRECP